MKKNLQRFGASVLAAAMVAQSVALPAAAETTKIDSSVAQQARPAAEGKAGTAASLLPAAVRRPGSATARPARPG